MDHSTNPLRSLLLPVLFALHAAAPAAGQTNLSVHAGITSAKLVAPGADDHDEFSDGPRRGLSLGAAAIFTVLPSLGLHLGGAYVQKGASIGILADDIVDAFVADLKLDYIELSALAKASIPAGTTSLPPARGANGLLRSAVYDRSDIFPRRGHGRVGFRARLFGRGLY